MSCSIKHISNRECNNRFSQPHFVETEYDWFGVDRRVITGFHKHEHLDDENKWVSIKKKPDTKKNDIEVQFLELAAKWEDETGFYSTMTPKITNRWYLNVIALGKEVVPSILKTIESPYGSAHWHTALIALTGENPVPENYYSNNKKIKEFWVRWGKDNKKI